MLSALRPRIHASHRVPNAKLGFQFDLFRGIDGALDALQQKSRRGKAKRADWTNGPAKLTAAFAITSAQNGIDLTTPEAGLWIEAGPPVADERVTIGPRVGLYSVPEPWKSVPWRFLVRRE